MAGLLLAIPDLLALELPGMACARQKAFLTALDKAAITTGLATCEVVNLDFHAVMHWGADPALARHYVPSRSQRTRSVLTFLAEDAESHALLYANAPPELGAPARDDDGEPRSAGSAHDKGLLLSDALRSLTQQDKALCLFLMRSCLSDTRAQGLVADVWLAIVDGDDAGHIAQGTVSCQGVARASDNVVDRVPDVAMARQRIGVEGWSDRLHESDGRSPRRGIVVPVVDRRWVSV
jgi:hypothetical protein